MLKIGTIGFGGGSALIPVMEAELVRRRHFLDAGAFTLHTVVANLTPGALPVKLAAFAGGRTRGALAGLLCAIAVALPGAALTVGLVAVFGLLGPAALRSVEFAAVGVTAFIIVLLVHYVTKVLRDGGPRRPVFVVIMALAFLATGAGAAVRLVGLLVGAQWRIAWPSLSAVGLVVAALTAIGIWSLVGPKPSVSGPEGSVMGQPLPGYGDKVRALVLQVGVMVAGVAVAVLVGGAVGGELLGLVGFSTVTSFGGGEAYVGVADGFFVGGGLIASEVFYGQIVPVANALPGPILIKVASGVGYSYGAGIGGPALGAVFALCAFATSIGACCAVALATITAWTKVARSAVMVNVGRYILPVICGLLLTTSVSMVLANAEIAERGGLAGAPVAWATLAGFAVMAWLQARWRVHDLVLLAAAGLATLTVLSLLAPVA